MAESIRQRAGCLPPSQSLDDVQRLFEAIRLDIEALRNLLATHVHSGITAGAANSGVPTVVLAAAALQTQP